MSATIAPSRSATSSKTTLSSTAWLSVSCTIAIEPTRRTASSSAALASALSIRRACSRSRAATVCRLFFTRWWISRMVASLVTSSRSRLRRSVTSRTSTSAPISRPCGRSGMARTISDTESVPISASRLARPPSTALSVSSSGRSRGGTSSRVTSLRRSPSRSPEWPSRR